MQLHLKLIKEVSESNFKTRKIVQFLSLGKSNGGLDIPLIKITNRDY